MIRSFAANGFKSVPYLEAAQVMQTHREGLRFSTEKPNVLVGPNGSGKSAVLTALSMLTLTYFTPVSAFDDNYTRGRGDGELWGEDEKWWKKDYTFLPGLTCDTDRAPALYYRPSHIPGNDDSITAAMMCGYFKEGREYGEAVEEKSSGQQAQALLAQVKRALDGDTSGITFQYVNWSGGRERLELESRRNPMPWDYKAEILKSLYGDVSPDAKPVLLLDEPEQSLDAKAEASLWRQIERVDASHVQVIVATHSLYPILHRERFNVIETVPGYVDEVRSLL